MKTRTRFSLWIIRIIGAFILTVGMTSPVFAAEDPALTIAMTHGSDFSQAEENRTYTITVTNSGSWPTNGSLITVTDSLPAGLVARDMSSADPAWTCPGAILSPATPLTCTRTVVLAAGENSVITLTVDVDVDAGDVGTESTVGDILYRTVTNSVTVNGGGSLDPDTALDLTRIVQKPDLLITGYEIRSADSSVVIGNPQSYEKFNVRMTIRNRGGAPTGSFYPGVFLDGKPNYGPDHDDLPSLIFGEVTDFADYRISPAGSLNFSEGCLYYDPAGTIDPLTETILPERGNYTLVAYIPDLQPGAEVDVDVPIECPTPPYDAAAYPPSGLGTGSYNIYLYADPNCNAGTEESFEDNNSLGPIPLNIGGGYPSGPTTIDVTIAGTSQGTYPMVPDTSMIAKYSLDGGPVVISSNNGVGIIASLNQWRGPVPYGGWTGVAQSMALPIPMGQISNKYVIPLYNGTDPTLYDAVLMANVDTVPRTITVTIGNTVMGSYLLGPSDSRFELYNVKDGPLVVSSVTGAKIVASLYELKRSGNIGEWNGQSEMMGVPWSQISDKYLIPIYFGMYPLYLDASIYIANADTVATQVEVKIAGVVRGTYTMDPGTSRIVKYSLDGGPVEVSSNNGAKIVASLNQWRRPTPYGGWTGVAQSMALPLEQVSNKYVIPLYNGTDPTLYDAVLMANVDTVPRTITVTIGGTVMGSYLLGPSDSRFELYNVKDGPLVVSSVDGAKIVASLYELKRSGNIGEWNGQSEMMGVPWSQISDRYLIPIYFGMYPLYLDASLYIAVP